MPKFNYTARDNNGTATAGEIVARTEMEAAQLLRAEGKFVTRLTPARDAMEAAVVVQPGSRRVKSDEVIYFANQLAGMIDSGVSIADALEASIDGTPPGAFRRTVEDVIHRVQSGSPFSASLAAHPKVFSPLFIHLVQASESTGMLGPMLRQVADYLGNQRELKKKIKGAVTYPCCMLLFAVGATVFLLTFVLPKFAAIYAGKEAILPLPTRIVMGTSTWMITHWHVLLFTTIAAVIGAIFYFRTTRGQHTADWLRLNVPLLGSMFQKACLTRSLRTLGTMISAGVSVLEAVLITRDVVGNRLFGQIFEDAHRRLERGEQLSQCLLDAPYFPRPVWQMLNAGERTGQLGPAMDRVAKMCESDLQHAIRSITQFIEPAMIVIMGIIIGGIALAMLLPIFQISKIMAH